MEQSLYFGIIYSVRQHRQRVLKDAALKIQVLKNEAKIKTVTHLPICFRQTLQTGVCD